MSGHIAVIYAGDMGTVAEAFADAVSHLAAHVAVAPLDGGPGQPRPDRALHYLEWADGIAFGTPAGAHGPAAALLQFLDSSSSLWSSGRFYDKAVTVLTDTPERIAAGSMLHPIYDALYRFGAIIVGPRDVDLGWVNRLDHPVSAGSPPLPGPRLRATQYRAHRLVGLASLFAEARSRQQALQL